MADKDEAVHGWGFAAASTLLRSNQTGELLAQRLGVPFMARDDLRELNIGTLEGRSEAELWDYFVQQ